MGRTGKRRRTLVPKTLLQGGEKKDACEKAERAQNQEWDVMAHPSFRSMNLESKNERAWVS